MRASPSQALIVLPESDQVEAVVNPLESRAGLGVRTLDLADGHLAHEGP
jgi:hypothetical protein